MSTHDFHYHKKYLHHRNFKLRCQVSIKKKLISLIDSLIDNIKIIIFC